jgi:hypothetical protein
VIDLHALDAGHGDGGVTRRGDDIARAGATNMGRPSQARLAQQSRPCHRVWEQGLILLIGIDQHAPLDRIAGGQPRHAGQQIGAIDAGEGDEGWWLHGEIRGCGKTESPCKIASETFQSMFI